MAGWLRVKYRWPHEYMRSSCSACIVAGSTMSAWRAVSVMTSSLTTVNRSSRISPSRMRFCSVPCDSGLEFQTKSDRIGGDWSSVSQRPSSMALSTRVPGLIELHAQATVSHRRIRVARDTGEASILHRVNHCAGVGAILGTGAEHGLAVTGWHVHASLRGGHCSPLRLVRRHRPAAHSPQDAHHQSRPAATAASAGKISAISSVRARSPRQAALSRCRQPYPCATWRHRKVGRTCRYRG